MKMINWIKEHILEIGIFGFVIFIIGLNLMSGISTYDDYDPVCEWYYTEWELLDYKDPGYGHAGVLYDIWLEANYGKNVDVDWYENYRLKYDLDSVPSFYLINYSNVCPREPNLKYLGTGMISNYVPWSYDGPAYSETTICINGTNTTYNNCGWHPYPLNHSHPVHIFREKHDAWWNNFKEVEIYDATLSYDDDVNNNESWINYFLDYQIYLDNGGVNVGSEYYSCNWNLELMMEYADGTEYKFE